MTEEEEATEDPRPPTNVSHNVKEEGRWQQLGQLHLLDQITAQASTMLYGDLVKMTRWARNQHFGVDPPWKILSVPIWPGRRFPAPFLSFLIIVGVIWNIAVGGKTGTALWTGCILSLGLFMLSLGVLNEHTAFPFRYYGAAHPELSRKARYVLDQGCHLQQGGELLVLARTDFGCLLERQTTTAE